VDRFRYGRLSPAAPPLHPGQFADIEAGHRYWECGDYGINPEHPPLLKLIATVPLRGGQFDVYSYCNPAM
jgi:hypothetical protein